MVKKISFLILSAILLGACSLRPPNVRPTQQDFIEAQPKLPANNQLTQSTSQIPMISAPTSVILHTNYGDITIIFYPEPELTVANFIKLATAGFYDGVKFHRVIKNFMVQTGDPLSKDDDWSDDGTGGPGYTFTDEINQHPLVRGSVAMANAGPNTNGSQFFIVTAEATPWLDGKHTNFGYVSAGMEVVDKIESVATNANDHPLQDIIIKKISINQP